MRIVRVAGAVLLFCALLVTNAQAAVTKHWLDRTLHLSLTYPGSWRVVPEHGAVLKLVAPDAAGEFEIFSLSTALSPAALTARADDALARLHCGTAVRHTSGTLGHLTAAGKRATGTCTGADQGWKVTVIAFNYGPGAILLRSWLFHAQPRDSAALTAIVSSLAPAP